MLQITQTELKERFLQVKPLAKALAVDSIKKKSKGAVRKIYDKVT